MTQQGLQVLLGCLTVASILAGCRDKGSAVSSPIKGEKNDSCKAAMEFVQSDEFAPEADSIYPRPSPCPVRIYEYFVHRYGQDVEVRRLMALYFLRYDTTLLSKGLISASSRNGDLISLLWEEEAARGFGQRESPGMSAMRQHIASNSDWFGLDADMIAVLRTNEGELQRLYGEDPNAKDEAQRRMAK